MGTMNCLRFNYDDDKNRPGTKSKSGIKNLPAKMTQLTIPGPGGAPRLAVQTVLNFVAAPGTEQDDLLDVAMLSNFVVNRQLM